RITSFTRPSEGPPQTRGGPSHARTGTRILLSPRQTDEQTPLRASEEARCAFAVPEPDRWSARYGHVVAVASQETALVAAVRAGDEHAFARLIDTYGAGMRRFALSIVGSAPVADEVVRESWLGVLRELDRFDGCASLKVWIFGIVATTADARAERESGNSPFATFAAEAERETPSVDPARFRNPQ